LAKFDPFPPLSVGFRMEWCEGLVEIHTIGEDELDMAVEGGKSGVFVLLDIFAEGL